MQTLTLQRRLQDYVQSIFFVITIAVLSFGMWAVEGNFAWIFASIYILISFFPLIADDGRAYIPLILFIGIIQSENISFGNIPPYFYAIGACVIVSILSYLFKKKMSLRKGILFFPLMILLLTFFFSYLVSLATTRNVETVPLFYLFVLFMIVVVYVIFNSCLRREDTIIYFARTLGILAVAITAEIFVFEIINGFEIGALDFSLGWSYTQQTASTILTLSLPFFSILISRKKPLWIIPELFVVVGIIVLSADSGILALLFFVVPIVVLSFKAYGRLYPYITLGILFSLGTAFVLLMVLNDSFSSRVMTAISSLNFSLDNNYWRTDLFQDAVDNFISSPIIGTSISSLYDSGRRAIVLSSNTVLSTMTMGGTIGLFAFVFYEICLYYNVLKKKANEKAFFIIFLLMVELIGLLDNTIYNIYIFLIFLLAVSCYLSTDRQDEIVVHDRFHSNYDFSLSPGYQTFDID